MGSRKKSIASQFVWVYTSPAARYPTGTGLKSQLFEEISAPMAKRKPTDIVGIKVRCLEALRARLAQEAKKNQRSLNGEIVYRLGASFGEEGVALASQFEEAEKEIEKRLREIVAQMVQERRR
jgi:hypothetical protein